MLDVNMAWSAALSLIVGILTFVAKETFAELARLGILLNKTREEVARDNVTKAEVERITSHIDQRFNRLEEKIDQLIQKGWVMPSVSKKQHNFMAAVAKNPTFAKKVGIKSSVGEEFLKADKGKKFGTGGMTRADAQDINKPKTHHGKMALFKKGGEMAKSDMKEDMKADIKQDKAIIKKAFKMHDKQEHKGSKGTDLSKLKKGGVAASKMGSVKTAAPSRDGIASKGKTKGMMVKMKKGGRAC